MLARLICFFLGHVYSALDVLESPQPHIRISYGECARCGEPGLEICDLRDEKETV